jgi:hypothetical protein
VATKSVVVGNNTTTDFGPERIWLRGRIVRRTGGEPLAGPLNLSPVRRTWWWRRTVGKELQRVRHAPHDDIESKTLCNKGKHKPN